MPEPPKTYCQPGDKCWPTVQNITDFKNKINGTSKTCLNLTKFVWIEEEAAHVKTCLNYTGLVPKNATGCPSFKNRPPTGYYMTPDPNCDANPYVTGASYNDEGLACMTPYQFLTNRNYKHEWLPAFIVTAETPEDISYAIKFAKVHNLGIAIINTGHDMQDRNAGPGPNSLLIRTTCFRNWTAHTDFTGQGPKDAQGGYWNADAGGYADVGAGLSFGMNFWRSIKNAVGVYQLASESNREIVGGTCHSVGIVGWSLGGGRGWTSPKFGLGVDQILQIDFVDAEGNLQTATPSANKDLYYAMRGGGGVFGVIYQIRIKLHSPNCKDLSGEPTLDQCYKIHNIKWEGFYDPNKTPGYVKDITKAYTKWSSENRQQWNAMYQLRYNKDETKYSLYISANYFKDSQIDTSQSLEQVFGNNFLDERVGYGLSSTGLDCKETSSNCNSKIWTTTTSKYWCEKWNNFNNGDDCTDAPWHLERWTQTIRFMVNTTTSLNDDFIDSMIDSWQPLCDKYPYGACASGYQIHGDVPAINASSGMGVHASESPVAEGFRTAAFQVFNYDVNSNKVGLTFVQKEEWMHSVLAPKLYKYSTASYFNEAEYTLNPGQWERRFWGEDNHAKLYKIKMHHDPEKRFACRHCVGSELIEN